MPGITVNVDAFVEDLFAHFRFATRQREWTASFFSTPCVETERKESEQVSYCLRFEDHWIRAGIECARIASIECFSNRFICDVSGVEFADVEVVAQEVTGTGSIGCSRGGRETHQTPSFVEEVAVLRGISTG